MSETIPFAVLAGVAGLLFLAGVGLVAGGLGTKRPRVTAFGVIGIVFGLGVARLAWKFADEADRHKAQAWETRRGKPNAP